MVGYRDELHRNCDAEPVLNESAFVSPLSIILKNAVIVTFENKVALFLDEFTDVVEELMSSLFLLPNARQTYLYQGEGTRI